MKTLLVGINAKYIHPTLAIYQLQLNCDELVDTMEFTIKEKIQDMYQKITKDTYDLIGFSCYLWNIDKVKKLCSLIKTNYPKTKILLGGPEVSYEAKYFLNNFKIDFVMRGEGEASFPLLIKHLKGDILIDQVPSISYLHHRQIVNNEIVLPDLNKTELAVFNVPDYLNRVIYLESSRGCPYNCSYCCAALEKKVRFFPVDKILVILKRLMTEQAKTVKFLDRTFNANKNYLIDILTFINKFNINTTFQFEIVVDRLDKEVLEFIASLNTSFLRFEIGIQSTNDIVSTSVNRSQDMDLLKKNIHFLSSCTNVTLHLDLIAGLPYETKESFIDSFNEVYYLQPQELQLGFLKFLRGTDILKQVNVHDYLYQEEPPYEIIQNKYLSIDDLNEIRIVENVLDKFYNSNRFKKTLNKCLELITSPYHFYLNLGNYAKQINFKFIGHQLIDIYIFFDGFLNSYFKDYYFELSFLLKQDYLESAKTKPKTWWENKLSKAERFKLYQLINQKDNSIKLDDLYRYSIVLFHNEYIYGCLYKNFKVTTFLINQH